MENINIYDNFLNSDEYNMLTHLLDTKIFKYGKISGYRERRESPFFKSSTDELFFTDYIKTKIENIFSKKLLLTRHYMIIQTFGGNGGYHVDDDGIDKMTFCLYITDIEDDNICNCGGEFLVKTPFNTHIISVDPKNNRGILFPSHYFHKGMAYNRLCNNKRLCIAWKFRLI